VSVAPIPLEDDEQIALVEYLELRGLKFTAIPNSTYTESWTTKARNTRLGLRPGLPDMVVILPGVGLVFIELKRQKRGVVSAAQQEWIDALNTLPGVEAQVCKGAGAAIELIESLLPSTRHAQNT
jgi:hypothetical protein